MKIIKWFIIRCPSGEQKGLQEQKCEWGGLERQSGDSNSTGRVGREGFIYFIIYQ